MNDNIVLNLIGGLFISAGLWSFVIYLKRSKTWIHAIGTVIEIREKQFRDKGRTTTLYSGTLAYHLPRKSDVFEFRDDVWHSPCPYVVDEEIPILVNPRNPKQAWVTHSKTRVIVPIAIIVGGVLTLIAANR